MGLNAVSEFGQWDATVTRITSNAARVQRQTLMRVLTKAKKTEGTELRCTPGQHGGQFRITVPPMQRERSR